MTSAAPSVLGPRTGPVAEALVDMAPLLRRAVGLDPRTLARVRVAGGRVTVFVRLPFGVLAARTVAAGATEQTPPLDRTVTAEELLGWLDGDHADPPPARDADWRSSAPPAEGWQRVDTVPDEVVRGLVRSGALALKDAAAREGVPGASPRAEVADALLDAVVLTVTGPADVPVPLSAEIRLRTLSALTRLGFLARGSHAAVDVHRGWVRVAGSYGSVFAERAPAALSVRRA
jgi:hypothetical protein